MIITISKNAKKKLIKLTRNTNKLIRAKNVGYNWTGPIWDIVLDEQNDDDILNEIDGIKILVDTKNASMINELSIDARLDLFWYTLLITIK